MHYVYPCFQWKYEVIIWISAPFAGLYPSSLETLIWLGTFHFDPSSFDVFSSPPEWFEYISPCRLFHLFYLGSLGWSLALKLYLIKLTCLYPCIAFVLLVCSSLILILPTDCAANLELLVRCLNLPVYPLLSTLLISLHRIWSVILVCSSLTNIAVRLWWTIRVYWVSFWSTPYFGLFRYLDLPVCPLLSALFFSLPRLGSMLLVPIVLHNQSY